MMTIHNFSNKYHLIEGIVTRMALDRGVKDIEEKKKRCLDCKEKIK